MISTETEISSSGEVYKHQPLDTKKHQIRLLKLHDPSEPTSEYRLVTFDYENALSYIALSYTWGESHRTGFISIDGKNFEIRDNLLKFLSTYRTNEYIWIDQICIDQSDTRERNHQVQFMSKIYSRCDFVLVWLRDETTYIPSTKQAALDFNNGVHSYPKHGRGENGSSDDQRCLEWPLLALLHNSYFDRLWIVQEILLSHTVRILIEGSVWVSWKSLQTKHRELQDKIKTTLSSTGWMLSSQQYWLPFTRYHSISVVSYITFIVGSFCDKKCKDPRDKVYGLMALVSPSSRVEIDYAKSVQQVCLDAIMSMIKEYWYLRRKTHRKEYRLLQIEWSLEKSRDVSLRIAQTMGFIDLEMSGLTSFVMCVWERVRWHEVTAVSLGLEVDPETHCIPSVGFEPKEDTSSSKGQLAVTCDRWWYTFDGEKYFHDCERWSGDPALHEYKELRDGGRVYGPWL